EDWTRAIGGILHYAGATSWMANYGDWIRSGDEFAADAAELFRHWWRLWSSADRSPAEILEMLKQTHTFPRVFVGHEKGEPHRLGKQVLGPLVDRPVGDFVMRRREYGNGSRYWLDRTKS